MMTLLVVAVPAFNALTAKRGVGAAAQDIAGALEIARVHAMSNNTYTWVGIFEEDAMSAPGTPGIGRIVLCMVASKTGSLPYDLRSPAAISASSLTQLGKLTRIEKVHLAALPIGTGGGDKLADRPPYSSLAATISDTMPAASQTAFQVLLGDTQYTFTKAIQFSPSGEARINNSASSLMPISEISLSPARGNTPLLNDPNKVAIQFTGTAGNVKIYRP